MTFMEKNGNSYTSTTDCQVTQHTITGRNARKKETFEKLMYKSVGKNVHSLYCYIYLCWACFSVFHCRNRNGPTLVSGYGKQVCCICKSLLRKKKKTCQKSKVTYMHRCKRYKMVRAGLRNAFRHRTCLQNAWSTHLRPAAPVCAFLHITSSCEIEN